MPLSADELARILEGREVGETEHFVLAPRPDSGAIRRCGSASIDLRLGTWFMTTKASRHSLLDIYNDIDEPPSEHNICDKHYVPLGGFFILHPHSFVLAATLEWLKMPKGLCGYVTGKSSWGRRGLIIDSTWCASGVCGVPYA